MIKLEVKFVSGEGGFASDPLTYTQLKRTDKVALYERSRDGKVKDYEVFFIKVDPKGKVQKFPNGVTKVLEDDREKYATSSQFGFIAWSFNSLGAAERRFEELCKEANTPEEEEEESKELTIPVGEFTVGEFASKNDVNYATAFLFIKDAVDNKKTIKFLREERRAAKGKPSKIFSKA